MHHPREDGSKAPAPIYPDGVDKQGKPKWTWLHPDGQTSSPATLREWYGPRRGIGLRCGSASGGLECFEFDCLATYEAFRNSSKECGLADLVARVEAGYLEETPGGGIHWLYFTDEVRGNTKLAKRPAPTSTNPHGVDTLVETRGENGFVIIAPSSGPVHPSGRPYVLFAGGIDTIVTLSVVERDSLWDLARSFDAMPRPAAEAQLKTCPAAVGLRPGEAFEREATWGDILGDAGWTHVYDRGETAYWRRPDKSTGISATTNYGGSGLLYVFTSSTLFDSEKSYTKFGAYAVLEHGGDHGAAARALRAKGYGEDRMKDPRRSGWTGEKGPEDLEPDDWPEYRLSEMPGTASFPVDALPAPVADCARAIAATIGCPTDFAGLSLLVVAGAAIGRAASLLLKPGYFASAALYGMNVGNATSGKTPSMEFALAPLVELNAEYLDKFLLELAQFDEEEDAWERAPKSNKPPRPVRPVLRTVLLNDCTTEIVKARLGENPRGLLNAYDEGSAWVGSLNQYKSGKGTDRQFYLSALNGSAIRVDRMKDRDRPTSIRHPFLSVLGNMTPETLGDLREGEGRSDGFVERILFALCEASERPFWSEEGFPPATAERWRLIVRRLHERSPVNRDGREVPHVVYFTPEAKRIWVQWFNANVVESRRPGYEASELSVDGKLENFTARMALIIHLLTLAGDGSLDQTGPIPELPPKTIDAAIELWRYFRIQHRRVRWQMNGGIENRDARLVLDWIRRHRVESFTRKEVTDHLRWLNERTGGPDGTLGWLEERHLLRRRPPPAREPGKRGQSPSPVYEVNPSFFASRNSQNSRNCLRQGSARGCPADSANSANSAKAHEGESEIREEEVTWTV